MSVGRIGKNFVPTRSHDVDVDDQQTLEAQITRVKVTWLVKLADADCVRCAGRGKAESKPTLTN
jgi:hypothetical protein